MRVRLTCAMILSTCFPLGFVEAADPPNIVHFTFSPSKPRVGPDPLAMTLRWIGESCNANGRFEIEVTNKSSRPMLMPRHASFNQGSMFYARVDVRIDANNTEG